MLASWKKSNDKRTQCIKKQRHHFVDKGPYNENYVFSSCHEQMTIKKAEHRGIDAFKLWCWRRLLRVSWIADIKPVHPKGNQPRIFLRTDAEAEAVILWPPDAKN